MYFGEASKDSMEELQLDPIRQVRIAKRWAFAGILSAIFVLVAVYSLTLDLSTLDLLYVLAPAAAVAAVTIEFAARWEARTHRRYAYPHRLGYLLAATHDFDRACETSAKLIGEWLDLDAVIIGWLSEDGQTVAPVAGFGMPESWLETAVSLPASEAGITLKSTASQSLQRHASDDQWFGGAHPRAAAHYLPLISGTTPEGVLAVAAGRRNPQIGDRKLLAALAMVLGLSLDNCRLYEGQRAHAQHFQELNRMKSDFLTTVSHELRTPLTSIVMAAEMLLEEEEIRNPDTTRGKLVRNIVKGAGRLRSLVDDLVAISREDDFQPRLELEPVKLEDPIANAVSIVQPLLTAKHQSLDVRLPAPDTLARIDRLRFEQVLINLLSNAQRYSPPGGHIEISVSGSVSETVIYVTDSGPGVAAEDAEMIFEPFYRGDRSGLGLGLAIAKSIVELHNGRIWVESADGHGSRFCVAVPAARVKPTIESTTPPARTRVVRGPAPTASRR